MNGCSQAGNSGVTCGAGVVGSPRTMPVSHQE